MLPIGLVEAASEFYFYDWTFCIDDGSRFENMVAVMLLRMVNRFNELGVGDFDIRYVRNKQKEEVDFLIVKNNKPLVLFEAKKSETDINKSGHYFSRVFNVPYYQLVCDSDVLLEYPENKFVISSWRFFSISG
jgi:predicted AAA+ superfamily ATPase